jgi:hypothetical protein
MALDFIYSRKLNVNFYDQNGDLLYVLDINKRTNVWWEFNRRGGCGQCQIEYPTRDAEFIRRVRPNCSVKISIDNVVRYTGKVISQSRSVATGSETVLITAYGYIVELATLLVRTSYTDQGLKTIAQDILDNYVVGRSKIIYSASDIDDPGYSAAAINFNHTAQDAMTFLANLGGNIEWGVDRNKSFYFKNYDTNIRKVYVLGREVTNLQEDFRDEGVINVLNIFSGSEYLFQMQSTMSVNIFGRREGNLFESSLESEADFVRLGTNFLKRAGSLRRSLQFSFIKPDEFLEQNSPIGAIAVSAIRFRERPKYGHTNKYGRSRVGVSRIKYGNLKRDQLSNIRYQIAGGGMTVDVTLEDDAPNVGDQSNRLQYEIKDLQRR